MISKILLVQDQLLKEGRGFDFQSHGVNKAGDDFYNFALYAVPGTKGSTHYINGFDTDDIAETVTNIIKDEGPVMTLPKEVQKSIKPITPRAPKMPIMPLPRG